SCPQQLANVHRDRRVRKLYFRSTLLRTRMSALRRRPKNLRDPRKLSYTVVQLAPTVRDCPILLHCPTPGALGIPFGAPRPTVVRIDAAFGALRSCLGLRKRWEQEGSKDPNDG